MKINQVLKHKFLSIVLTLTFLYLMIGCSPVNSGQSRGGVRDGRQSYTVMRVIDGDTIVVDYDGKKEKVRFIGVNTPEIHHPRKGKEVYGPEAAEFTEKLLEKQKVTIRFDVERRDKYGRLLGYVYLSDGTFINAKLVSEGYAQVMTVPPNVKYAKHFLKLQRQAKESGRGLWAK